MKPRKSLQEMAAGGTNGITCRECGGRLCVTHTRHRQGKIQRRRVCPKCGWRVTTFEREAFNG